MQHRRAYGHGLFDGEDGGEDVVIDVDELERLLGDVETGGTNGGDGVALVQHFVAGQRVAEVEGGRVEFGGQGREVGGGDHRAHAG